MIALAGPWSYSKIVIYVQPSSDDIHKIFLIVHLSEASAFYILSASTHCSIIILLCLKSYILFIFFFFFLISSAVFVLQFGLLQTFTISIRIPTFLFFKLQIFFSKPKYRP